MDSTYNMAVTPSRLTCSTFAAFSSSFFNLARNIRPFRFVLGMSSCLP